MLEIMNREEGVSMTKEKQLELRGNFPWCAAEWEPVNTILAYSSR